MSGVYVCEPGRERRKEGGYLYLGKGLSIGALDSHCSSSDTERICLSDLKSLLWIRIL